MMRKRRMAIVIMSICLIVYVYFNWYPNGEGVNVMEIFVFSNNTSTDSYNFTLKDDGTMEVSKGERHSHEFNMDPFLQKINKTASVRLSYIKVRRLVYHAERIDDKFRNVPEYSPMDGYTFRVLYKGDVYSAISDINDADNLSESEDVCKLVLLVSKESPIPIKVDTGFGSETIE